MDKDLLITYNGTQYKPSIHRYEVHNEEYEWLKSAGLPAYEKPLYSLAVLLTDPQTMDDFPATVSFGNLIGAKNYTYFDVNNCPGIVDVLVEAGVISQPVLTMRSGFVEYPLCALTDDFISTFGGVEYEAYSKAYDDYMQEMNFQDEPEVDEEEII